MQCQLVADVHSIDACVLEDERSAPFCGSSKSTDNLPGICCAARHLPGDPQLPGIAPEDG
jgi:hypothetical protein